jgi:flavin reductase (DIM6/NTAB) family NADH-FMN oxidoreductase RutF
MQINSNDLDPEAIYKLLTGIVVPRPIAWVTTISPEDCINLAPFSAFTFVSNKPPMLGINIGRKSGVIKDTAKNIRESGEFVVNIPDDNMIEPVHLSAVEHPPDVSEVELLNLSTEPSTKISVPRLLCAPVSMECKLHSVTPFGDTGSEFFVGEVLEFHIRDDLLADGKINTAKLHPICRIGGPNYATLGEVISMQPIAQSAKTLLTKRT